MHLGERRHDLGRVGRRARVEEDAEGVLELLDRLLRLAEQEVEPAEVVQQLADVGLVGELLVLALRALRVRPREQPVAVALGDQRGLEEDVGDGAPVVQALGELERALDVLAGGLPVALPAIAAGAPAQDVRAERVAREARALGERRAPRRTGRATSRCSRACSGRRRGGRAPRPARRRRTTAARRAARALSRRSSAERASPCSSRAQPSPESARASSSGEPVPATATLAFSNSASASSYSPASVSASARVSVASIRPRSSADTPLARKLGSTPRRIASHSTVSRVGRVLPRSIWETYSLEKRSPARSLCVRPGGDAQLPQPLAEANRCGALAGALSAGDLGHGVLARSQAHTSLISNDDPVGVPQKGHIRWENG